MPAAYDKRDLLSRLLALDTPVFNRMVMKAGLPASESRELVTMFRELKE